MKNGASMGTSEVRALAPGPSSSKSKENNRVAIPFYFVN